MNCVKHLREHLSAFMSLYPHLLPDTILLIYGMISAVFLLCLYCTLVRPRHQHRTARDLGIRLQRLLVIFDFTVVRVC